MKKTIETTSQQSRAKAKERKKGRLTDCVGVGALVALGGVARTACVVVRVVTHHRRGEKNRFSLSPGGPPDESLEHTTQMGRPFRTAAQPQNRSGSGSEEDGSRRRQEV